MRHIKKECWFLSDWSRYFWLVVRQDRESTGEQTTSGPQKRQKQVKQSYRHQSNDLLRWKNKRRLKVAN